MADIEAFHQAIQAANPGDIVEVPASVLRDPPAGGSTPAGRDVDGTAVPTVNDKINHPEHYTIGHEVYPFVRSWSMSFAEGNVIKYLTRAPHKGKRLEDLKKARWYLERLIEEAELEAAK